MPAHEAAVSSPEDCTRRHRAGSAWTDRGSAILYSARPGHVADAVRCHRRAIELMSTLPIAENPGYLADLGAAWVNLGCALQAGLSPGFLEEANEAFERAVALLERLPFGAHPRFRHNLAAAWMNRADTLARIDSEASRAAALKAYVKAIEIARELPLDERASFRILLASCSISLGNLNQRQCALSEAMRAYDDALAALGSLPESGHRMARHHAATAWTNRGEALLQAGPCNAPEQAVHSAKMALGHLRGREIGGATNVKLGLRALWVMARGLEGLVGPKTPDFVDQVAEVTDIAERGMELALAGRECAPEICDPFFVWFYTLGSRVYGRYQPHFLSEFLDEGLQRWKIQGNAAIEAKLRLIARRDSIAALKRLRFERMLVDGTRHAELLLSTVCDLSAAASSF